MKTIFLALALLTTGVTAVHAAQDPDTTPCDAVDEDHQTVECAVYSKNTAEQLLEENFKGLLQRAQTQLGANKTQLDDFTSKIKAAELAWQKLRDADCAVEVFPAVAGSKDFIISENDCLARMSDERSEYLETIAQE